MLNMQAAVKVSTPQQGAAGRSSSTIGGCLLAPHTDSSLKEALLAPLTTTLSVEEFLRIAADSEHWHGMLSENYLRIASAQLDNDDSTGNAGSGSNGCSSLAALQAVSSCADCASIADVISGSARCPEANPILHPDLYHHPSTFVYPKPPLMRQLSCAHLKYVLHVAFPGIIKVLPVWKLINRQGTGSNPKRRHFFAIVPPRSITLILTCPLLQIQLVINSNTLTPTLTEMHRLPFSTPASPTPNPDLP